MSLKAGLEHEKLPDVPSVRETNPEEERSAFEKGDWRYWIGGTYRLPWRMEFDGEVFLLDPYTGAEYGRGWRTTLRRNGLPLVPAASLSFDVGGVSGTDEPGYSGRLSTRLPILSRSFSLTSSAGFRFLEPDASRSFAMSDVSLMANWRRDAALSMFAAVTYSFGAADYGGQDETVFQVGTQVVW